MTLIRGVKQSFVSLTAPLHEVKNHLVRVRYSNLAHAACCGVAGLERYHEGPYEACLIGPGSCSLSKPDQQISCWAAWLLTSGVHLMRTDR